MLRKETESARNGVKTVVCQSKTTRLRHGGRPLRRGPGQQERFDRLVQSSRFDSPCVFGALLDATKVGYFRLAPGDGGGGACSATAQHSTAPRPRRLGGSLANVSARTRHCSRLGQSRPLLLASCFLPAFEARGIRCFHPLRPCRYDHDP
jgi:hypothetical protein